MSINNFLLKIILLLSIFFAPFSYGNDSQSNQISLNSDSINQFNKYNAELNSIYNKIISLTSDLYHYKLLSMSERTWKQYVELDCKFREYNFKDGTVYSMLYYDCLKDYTEERIKRLSDMINCEEGDMSCINYKN